MIKRLESLGGDVREAVSEGLSDAAATIANDTEKAMNAPSLPAHGDYSSGKTKRAIVKDEPVTWEGSVAHVPVGFDFSKPGAGGFLISGTPRMAPDKALNKIYKQKRYMTKISKDIEKVIMNHIVTEMAK